LQEIVHFNQLKKNKTDEMELFYGKIGVNNIFNPRGHIAVY